jgi:hypothetical protein
MFAMVLSHFGWAAYFLGAVQQAILFETCPDLLTVFYWELKQAHDLTVM